MDFKLSASLKNKYDELISSYPHLADLDADEIADPPPLAESNLTDDIRAVDDSSSGSYLLAEKIPDYF